MVKFIYHLLSSFEKFLFKSVAYLYKVIIIIIYFAIELSSLYILDTNLILYLWCHALDKGPIPNLGDSISWGHCLFGGSGTFGR